MKRLVVILPLLVILPLVISGCVCYGAYPKELIADVLSDGDDTFVAYQLERDVGDSDVRLQKLGDDGDVIWDKALFSVADGNVGNISLVSGDDGVFVAWQVHLPMRGQRLYDFDHATLASVDSDGDVRWQWDFGDEAIHMVADGGGGVVMAWPDGGRCYARGVDSQGDVLWEETLGGGSGPELAAGEEGEAFILWNNYDNNSFLVQKVSADGELLWAEEGVAIEYAETAFQLEPQMVSDGMGGAIVAWVEESSEQPPGCVWLQFIGDDGQDLGRTAVGGPGAVVVPHMRLVVDEPLGFIAVWESLGDGIELRVKRTNLISSYFWPPEGVSICSGLGQSPRFSVTSDEKGGVVVAWIDGDRRLYAQRLDGCGEKLWGDEGVLITHGACELLVWVEGDGESGFVVGWTRGSLTYHPDDSYLQRLDAEGNVLWKEGGIKIRP